MEIRADLSECPHCRGKTALAPHSTLRWVCAACGGPRVPGGPASSRSLTRARASQAATIGWTAGAVALTVTGAMTAALAVLLWMASSTAGITTAVVSLLMLLFAWRVFARARARRRELTESIAEAWREAARAIVRARGGTTTAGQLAEAMRIDEGEAEELLITVAAHEEVRIFAENPDGKYRVESNAPEEEDAQAEAERERAGHT